MAIGSLEFIVLLLLLTACFFQVPRPTGRRTLLSLCNLGFISLLLPNIASALFLLAFLGTGYVVAIRLRERPQRWLLAIYLFALVLSFAVVQRYAVVRVPLGELIRDHSLAVVGISYMLFRQIHFLVDCMQGQIPRSSWWGYLNYQINFLALVAGPIQRFQDFHRFWQAPMPLLEDRNDVLRSYFRIFYGVVCVAGLSAVMYEAHSWLQKSLAETDLSGPLGSRAMIIAKIIALVYVYPLYMYFNFAGYCHIVIGGAALLGLRLPENFDKPYLARNILDFWTRWHQSLGFWVRDYLFTPMYMSLARWNARTAVTLAFLCYFVAFVVMGIWHGTGYGFLIFGLLHGLGGSAAKLWETILVKRRGRKALRVYLESRPIRLAAIFGTLTYFSFSLLFFSSDLEKFMIPWRALRHALSF
jgi:D-alanyl-lipoteichoic acid acyltransferase DltB (MBOAT superfamily)